MKVCIWLYIIFSLGIHQTSAQSPGNLDSLFNALSQAKDSNKVNILNELCDYYEKTQPDKAARYASEALDLARKKKFQKGICNSLNNLSVIFWSKGEYPKALDFVLESLKISESLKDKKGMATSYNIIGLIQDEQKNYKQALRYYRRALLINEEIKDDKAAGTNLNNLGEIYKHQGNYNEALNHYFKALRISDLSNNERLRAISLNNIGEIYNFQRNPSQALEYFIKSLKIKKKQSDKKSLAITQNNIAAIYLKIGEIEEARKYAVQSLENAEAVGSQTEKKAAYLTLSDLYAAQNEYEKAYLYYKKFNLLKDSLFSGQNLEKINELQSRYEAEKEEKEIEILKNKRERDQLIQLLLFVALIALVAISFSFYNSRRLKIKKNKIITQRNKELLEAREEIRQTNEELLATNANLEQIVQQRTQSLKQANEDLLLSNRELDIFIYRASHDFKAPIASLQGLTHLAKIESKEQKALDFFERIELTLAKTDSMLTKLLMVNTINHKSNKKLSQYVSIDFHKMTSDIVQLLPAKTENLQEIQYHIDIQPSIEFLSDSDLIHIILYNLIENAVYYSLANPESIIRIDISIKQDNKSVAILIRDQGIGIPEEYRENIFQMFFRGSELSKGNGLGLYVVKRALDKLKGTIGIESKINEFTCFEVYIPKNEKSD